MYDNERPDGRIWSPSRRRFLAAAGSIGAASVATGTGAAAAGDDGAAQQEQQPFTAIEFGNQTSDGTEVMVDAALLSEGGYVAIHDTTLFEGQVAGSVIGVTEFLDPGVHYGVPVTLFQVPGADFDRNQLEGTTPLVAMPHMETSGNETYDFVNSGGQQDGPYAEAGLPAVDAGFVAVGGQQGGGDQFATLEFQNQSAGGGSVTIREAVLSDGGFVALHDARLLGGDLFGSVVGVSEYLQPGRHQSVDVTVDDPSSIAEVPLPARPLLPMPHLDTNGNQQYDFVDSQGGEDGPYTKAGQAVIDAGLVTVQ